VTCPVPAEDGNVQAALEALTIAVDALTAPQSKYLEDRLVYAPSRYMQLRDAVTGEQMHSGGGGGGKSRPPFWTSAFDALNEIDTAVECWQPAFTGVPPTVGRLACIVARGWRPQDVRQIEQITHAVQAWCMQVDELLNPPTKWTLPYPCPNCQAKTVYRKDSGGETVRSNALQLSPEGCYCAQCKAHWPPGRFLFLGRLLGSVPANVDID
jgi:hypothetical protein